MTTETKPIAFYLPQYHSIPENDKWWGKGFTEWTNVKKAKPLYKGHKQPKIPYNSNYYNLLEPEAQIWQSETAMKYGVYGFCYWHYWFGNGKQLLEKPAQNMLKNNAIKIPFCFAWANETWTGRWHGLDDKILISQEYCGLKDDTDHFYRLLPFFSDGRYIKKNGKPVFVIYKPYRHPNLKGFTDLWNSLSIKEGFPGLYFIGLNIKTEDHVMAAVDASIKTESYYSQLRLGHADSIYLRLSGSRSLSETFSLLKNGCMRLSYSYMVSQTSNNKLLDNQYPVIMTGWDNTPRSGKKGLVLDGCNPDIFKEHVKKILDLIKDRSETYVFIKSWNEWAEGNYLEPDAEYGYEYLKALGDSLDDHNKAQL